MLKGGGQRGYGGESTAAELFAGWLRQRYEEEGYTNQAELAKAAEISQGTVSRWLKGDLSGPGALPLVENLRPLARALGVPLLELYVRVGYLTQEEANQSMMEREVLDPRCVRMKQILRKVDSLPARQRLVAEGVLASMDAILDSLERMTEPLTRRLLPTRLNIAPIVW